MSKYQAKRTRRRSRTPNRWRRRQTGWGDATSYARRDSKRLETRSPGVRISDSRATPRRTYLRRPHLLPSIPDGPLRLSARPINENDAKRTLEKSVKPTHLPGYTVASRPYWASRIVRNRCIWTGRGAGAIPEARYTSTKVLPVPVEWS